MDSAVSDVIVVLVLAALGLFLWSRKSWWVKALGAMAILAVIGLTIGSGPLLFLAVVAVLVMAWDTLKEHFGKRN